MELFLLVFVLFFIWLGIAWVVGPLDRAAKNRRYPVQFSLADFFCLFVLVQLPLGTLRLIANDSQGISPLDLFAALSAVAIWWHCVRTLSRAGIHKLWHRCFALTIAMPFAVYGSFALIILPVTGMVMRIRNDSFIGWWMLLAEAAVIGVFYGLGKYTRAIVASTEAQREEEELLKELTVFIESGEEQEPEL
jgi:hypothetical protein